MKLLFLTMSIIKWSPLSMTTSSLEDCLPLPLVVNTVHHVNLQQKGGLGTFSLPF